MTICAKAITWKAGQKIIVDGVSLAAAPGMMLGLLGPNGSGKSSLIRLLAGIREPIAGEITLNGTRLERMTRRQFAQRVALVEQHATTDAHVSVLDVVRLGRTPHRSALSPWTQRDDEVIEQSLDRVGLSDRRFQAWHTLSGGERQRVHLARALAQEPTDLILDEPTNHLDIHHQLDLLKLVAALPVTSVVALHDLNLAAMFCDHLAVMKGGKLVATGRPEDVLTEELIFDVFKVRSKVMRSQLHRGLHVQYIV